MVTALKLQARKYPTLVFGGLLFFPYSSLKDVSKVVSKMAAQKTDPKLAMHVVNRGAIFGEPPQGARPGIGIMMFDANGEEHARSGDGFADMYKVPECQEIQAGMMSVLQMNALAESYRDWQGNNQFWLSAPLLSAIDDETLVRAWKWWEENVNLHNDFQEGSTVLLEFMQEV